MFECPRGIVFRFFGNFISFRSSGAKKFSKISGPPDIGLSCFSNVVNNPTSGQKRRICCRGYDSARIWIDMRGMIHVPKVPKVTVTSRDDVTMLYRPIGPKIFAPSMPGLKPGHT